MEEPGPEAPREDLSTVVSAKCCLSTSILLSGAVNAERYTLQSTTVLSYVRTTRVYNTRWFKHNPKFRQPRMPHAIATRMSHIWYHADPHEQWKRVT